MWPRDAERRQKREIREERAVRDGSQTKKKQIRIIRCWRGGAMGGEKRKEKVPVIGEWVLRKGQKIKGGKRFVPQLSKNRS